jgi:hypothetical protein
VRHTEAIWYPATPAWRGVTTSLITPDGGALQRAFPFLAGAHPEFTFGCSAESGDASVWAFSLRFAGAGNAVRTPGEAERAYAEGTRALLAQAGRLVIIGSRGDVVATADLQPGNGVLRTVRMDRKTTDALFIARLIRVETLGMLLEAGTASMRDGLDAMKLIPCATRG